MERLTKRAYQCLTINTQDQHHENWLLFDHKYSLGSRLSLSTLSLSVNSDTEWEMRVLRWKTTEQAIGGSRSSDKGGAGHPGGRSSGGPVSKKKCFRPFGPQFGLRIRGDPSPPDPSPGFTTEGYGKNRYVSILKSQVHTKCPASCSFFPPVLCWIITIYRSQVKRSSKLDTMIMNVSWRECGNSLPCRTTINGWHSHS